MFDRKYIIIVLIFYTYTFLLCINAYLLYNRAIKYFLFMIKMLKTQTLLSVVYGVLFLWVAIVLFLAFGPKSKTQIVFEYPNGKLSFAWENMPIEDFDVKTRFDKEFLLTSNNLYQFYLYVKRYPVYIPDIKKALLDADIPEDFVYLPIAESALRNDVVSHAWAAGIWQFMPETAKRYGLVVDDYVDERYHVEKSTISAIEYLRDLHDIFDDWTLSAAAYNRWENGLRRDMKSQWVDSYYEVYLNEETSRYVFRITAIKYVMQSYFEKKQTIDRIIGGVHKKPITQEIEVWAVDDVVEWWKQYDMSLKDIKVLNRWILGTSLPKWNWKIKVYGNIN